MNINIRLQPHHQIESVQGSDSVWQSTGTDPQFMILSNNSSIGLRKGHYYFEFYCKCEREDFERLFQNPCLFFDNGEGFSAGRAIRLRFRKSGINLYRAYFFISADICGLRFDPSEIRTEMQILAPALVRISRLRWYAEGIRHVRQVRNRHGVPISKDIQQALRLLRTSGLSGLAAQVRYSMQTASHGLGGSLSRPLPAGPLGIIPENESIYYEAWKASSATAEGYRSPLFAAERTFPAASDAVDVKLMAYYLPQFHTFPENDEWWGKGFTEWTNVTKAVPRFLGHYQPKLPSDLGFYDLRNVEVMRKQAALAKTYGITAFCFHFYWFGGKTLMETPVENFLKADDIDLQYSLCWANENWTRRWDGAEHEVLISQHHSPEDDIAFIRHVSRYFSDPRYLKIDGRPVLTVYRPGILPDPKATAQRWRNVVRELGYPDLYLVATTSFAFTDYESIGFDALSEFPPHAVSANEMVSQVDLLDPRFKGSVFDYQTLVEMQEDKPSPSGVVFPGVMPAWDNVARRPLAGHLFHRSTPEAYRRWLRMAMERARKNPPGERFVLINAWNEWAEGAYLEPDRLFGHAYLWATASVIDEAAECLDATLSVSVAEHNASFRPSGAYAVAAHLFYPDAAHDLAQALTVRESIDIYITIPNNTALKDFQYISTQFPRSFIMTVENSGRDIYPFLKIMPDILCNNYAWVCKIHSKKSTHLADGLLWRRQLFNALLGGLHLRNGKITHSGIQKNKKYGILGPKNSILKMDDASIIINNHHVMDMALSRVGIEEDIRNFSFVAGSMFWFKPDALRKLSEASFKESDFGPELGRIDGTLAHAIERIFGIVARDAGYEIGEVSDGGKVTAKIIQS